MLGQHVLVEASVHGYTMLEHRPMVCVKRRQHAKLTETFRRKIRERSARCRLRRHGSWRKSGMVVDVYILHHAKDACHARRPITCKHDETMSRGATRSRISHHVTPHQTKHCHYSMSSVASSSSMRMWNDRATVESGAPFLHL